MSLLENILESIFGKVHFMVLVGNKPAIEIMLEDKDIMIDIKNPVLAIELGIEEILGRKSGEAPGSLTKKLKSMGYRIKVKYKFLELEI